MRMEDVKKYLIGVLLAILVSLLYVGYQDHYRLNALDGWAGMMEQERQKARQVMQSPSEQPPPPASTMKAEAKEKK